MIHRESLATEELCPELSEVMDTMIKNVNYIKTRPLKSRILQNYGGNGGTVSVTLFYCNSYWLSKGKFVARVYNLRE
jgi:hypothetical protein